MIFHVFFDIEFCIDFLKLFVPKINQNGSQNISCGHPFWLPKSTLAPEATFGCTLVAFRLPFACFELHLNRFGLHFVAFCVCLATFRVHVGTFSLLRLPCGTLFTPFSSLFLILKPSCRFFLHLDCLRFRCWSHFQCKYNFGAPNATGNHSNIIQESQP